MKDFTIRNVPELIKSLGDLYKPLLAKTNRLKWERFLK